MAHRLTILARDLVDAMTRSLDLDAALDLETGEIDLWPVGFAEFDEATPVGNRRPIPRLASSTQCQSSGRLIRSVSSFGTTRSPRL